LKGAEKQKNYQSQIVINFWVVNKYLTKLEKVVINQTNLIGQYEHEQQHDEEKKL
jgi:hypothetical protein